MEPLTPLETVRAFIAAVERRDIDAALAFVDEQCEYDNVPLGKNFGRESIGKVLGPFITTASEVEWVTHREAATGPIVCNERTDRFRFPHGWVEMPVTGVWEVHDGLITLWRDYFDAATFTSQMPGRS